MTKTLPIFLLIILMVSCCPEPRELTQEQIDQEKNDILAVINEYISANEEENFSAMVPTLAGEVYFFGTDSAEVIKTFADFKRQMMDQWERYDKMDYGRLQDVHIQMDKNAEFASVIFGVPVDIYKNGRHQHLYLRMQRTMIKEKDKWVISSGIVGAVRSGDILSNLEVPKSDTTETGEAEE